ncbi:hypothetical protein B0T10DRAFT_459669 [Thelonectria olida]|uniref:Uncharacterized protein n=1 Tax=Thelonectria olida TaxID=1576542 RepID=A0A9P8W402_9HYPO|nr:hypothetical protein B0T10DRAFT_459669 [Thelonectria olida]
MYADSSALTTHDVSAPISNGAQAHDSAFDPPTEDQPRSPRMNKRVAPNPNRYFQGLVNMDAFNSPAETYHKIYHFWISLLHATTLPDDASSCWDPRLGNAIQAVEDILKNDQHAHVFSRLAYVHLTTLLEYLQKVVRNDRLSGRLPGKAGKGDASIAIDIHEKSVSTTGKKNAKVRGRITRHDVKMRRRIARRWNLLTAGSPFLLLVYSDKAESIIRDFSVSKSTLKILAEKMKAQCPRKFVKAVASLKQFAEQALQEKYNDDQIAETFLKFQDWYEL